MKKFQFSLDSILGYRQQVLESRQNEYAKALARLHQQQDRVDDAKARYQRTNQDFRDQAASGITVADAMSFENGLRALENEIARETRLLEECRQKAEEKRALVLEAHKDATMLERLKEKQRDAYQKDLQKSDERFIDELVSAARAVQSES